jgi:hypothetical protein
MAVVTTVGVLKSIVTACKRSALVQSYTVRDMDEDILSVRVYLQEEAFGAEAFIEAFYNVATQRTSFALIVEGRRVYGKDNARKGWHVHPFSDPNAHHPCQPTDFPAFLSEVEAYIRSS